MMKNTAKGLIYHAASELKLHFQLDFAGIVPQRGKRPRATQMPKWPFLEFQTHPLVLLIPIAGGKRLADTKAGDDDFGAHLLIHLLQYLRRVAPRQKTRIRFNVFDQGKHLRGGIMHQSAFMNERHGQISPTACNNTSVTATGATKRIKIRHNGYITP